MTGADLWYSGFAAAGALLASVSLRPLLRRLAADPRAAGRVRWVAAARIALVLFAAGFVLVQIMRIGASWSFSVQAFAWAFGGLLALPWLSNGVAGLWFLARAGDAGIGDGIVARGQSGRIRDFGLTLLELESDAERLVCVPYASLLREPFLIKRRGSRVASTLTFEQPEWSEDDLRFVRQAAVLAPYRDVTAPVSVDARGSLLTLSMALVRPDADVLMKRLLLDGLAQRRTRRPGG